MPERKRANAEELRELLEAQGYKCALTGSTLTPETSTVDHILPRKHGGGSTIENLQWVTKATNTIKHTLTMQELDEWVDAYVKQRKKRKGKK